MLLYTGFTTIVCLELLILVADFVHVEGKEGFGGTEQEWGYVTVRPHAHMFWWLYYTTAKNGTNVHDKPLLIWIEGGPGQSSAGFGNFDGFGPLDVDLKPRNLTWVTDYNVLFIDGPVGTGYSYVETEDGYVKNNTEIALDLVECIKEFLKKFPVWSTVPTYITGVSYGGKMGVEFAVEMYKAQKAGNITSNLRGVALFDSWISPVDSVLSWPSFLLQTGLIGTSGFRKLEEFTTQVKNEVENEDWLNATLRLGTAITAVHNLTGFAGTTMYNIVEKVCPDQIQPALGQSILTPAALCPDDFRHRDERLHNLMNNNVNQVLDTNVPWEVINNTVRYYLVEEFMKPVTDRVEWLLNNTDIEVFVITGQLDLIAATPGTVAWVERLSWKNGSKWGTADRVPLVVNGVIEGYVQSLRNFKMYWVNRAGHLVPRDNPVATMALLKDLTANVTYE